MCTYYSTFRLLSICLNYFILPWYVTVFLYTFRKLLNNRLWITQENLYRKEVTAGDSLNNCQNFTHACDITISYNMHRNKSRYTFLICFEFPHFRAHNYAYNTQTNGRNTLLPYIQNTWIVIVIWASTK